jgi:uncharacterized protein (TIGR02147 family)
MIKELLKSEFKKRQKKNPKYSLRSFARDLKLNPSMVSRFLAGEREPTTKTIEQILERLNMESVLAPRNLAGSEDQDFVEIDSAQIEKLNHWLYFALLERCQSERAIQSLSALAKELSQTIKEIESKVAVLTQMGLLIKTQKGYRARHAKQTAKVSRQVLDQIHSGYLEQAVIAMAQTKEEDRNNSGTTILVHPKRLAEANEKIKLFRRSLARFLEMKTGEEGSAERLYRIQIALFPLDRK